MYGVLERFNQQSVAQQAPQPTYAPPPQAPANVELGDDEFLTGRQVKSYLQQRDQAMIPQFQQSTNLAAQTTLGLVQQKYAGEFQKYGPEIQGYLANLPREAWSLDNLERVVKIVRADHLDELVDERARQRTAEMVPSQRPNGGATEPPQVSTGFTQKTTTEWAEKARSVNLDENTVREFCAANNMPVEKFYDQFKHGLITAAIAESRPRPVVR
jgi:hypothetical protein